MSCEEVFLKELKDNGLRLTPQREVILNVLHQRDHPSTVEEIYIDVSMQDDNIELSTVYRTLDLLMAIHLVDVIDQVDKQRLYELTEDHTSHIHLVCRMCGKIIRADVGILEILQQILKERLQFSVDPTNMTILGICGDCAKAEDGIPVHLH